MSSIAISAAALPPRFVATFLVQSFFTHGQANYWYVEREWLLGKLDAVYEDVGSLTRRDVGTVCMIFMVLAIGTQYAYLDLYADPKGDSAGAPGPGRADSAMFSEDAIGVMFYQQACRLLPDVITISSLESVQACLLIGIYTLPIDASGLSYVYLNLAVKLAIQNGMHRRYLGEDLDPTVRETRNRVWWTAYTIERYVAIRCSMIRKPRPRLTMETDESASSTEGRYPSRTRTSTQIFPTRASDYCLLQRLSMPHTFLRRCA